MKAGLEKAQQLSGFAHSVPQTPELCCNPVTCHEAADVAEAMGRREVKDFLREECVSIDVRLLKCTQICRNPRDNGTRFCSTNDYDPYAIYIYMYTKYGWIYT